MSRSTVVAARRANHPTLARAAALVLLAILAAGCSLLPPDYTVHVSNSTTLPLTVVVNGQNVGVVQPESRGDYSPNTLPSKPWSVEARMSSGRVLATMTVEDGAIQDKRALDGTGEYSSVGGRVTLSCGQIWLWVGEPGYGGGAAEGVPGDCNP